MDIDKKNALTKIYSAAVASVDPYTCVRDNLFIEPGELVIGGTRYSLSDIRKIYVVGAGKASYGMARAVDETLGELITDGLVVTTDGSGGRLRHIKVVEASHPLPDGRGLIAATRIRDIVSAADEEDLVICLFSGGASSLMVLPAEGLTLKDKQEVTQLLLASGADINEINSIRKHLSGIKGGRLAEAAYPAAVSTLLISDVIGNDVSTIASGPTAPDETTFMQAAEILKMRGVYDRLPSAVREHLNRGCLGALPETPKLESGVFGRVDNLPVAFNSTALNKAREVAEYMGYNAVVLESPLAGEATESARKIAREVIEYRHTGRTPACLIAGGETTVTVTGRGRGGRNQESALAFATEIDGDARISGLFAGTDGIDGPTDAAGAFVDGNTVAVAAASGLDAAARLMDNDSYTFFKSTGGLFIPGPTGTNVMDIAIILID